MPRKGRRWVSDGNQEDPWGKGNKPTMPGKNEPKKASGMAPMPVLSSGKKSMVRVGFQFLVLVLVLVAVGLYQEHSVQRAVDGAETMMRVSYDDTVAADTSFDMDTPELQADNGIYKIGSYYFVDVSEEDPDRVGEVSRMLTLTGTMELDEGAIDASRLIAPIEGCVFFQLPV